MSKPTFVYVTYIGSRPEKVWQALTDGEFTKQHWGNRRNASDWKVGSPWRHEDFDDASLVDIVGTVVESSPPRRLVISWAFPKDAGNPQKTSRGAFDIETYGDAVRLTVTPFRARARLPDAAWSLERLAARAIEPEITTGDG